jgi:small GTP-binding protein
MESLKIIVVGNSSVGKSALLVRYTYGVFDDSYMSTIGVDFKTTNIPYGGRTIKLNIWDTAGQERFRTITTSYYRGSHAVILAFDLTDNSPFPSLDDWIGQIRHIIPNSKIFLVGTKADMQHAIDRHVIEEYAEDKGVIYTETSAMTGQGIDDLFRLIVQEVLKDNENNRLAQNGPSIDIGKTYTVNVNANSKTIPIVKTKCCT